MAYVEQDWETGDVITAPKLNHMEAGIMENAGSYVPTNWQTGDVITAEKLNHMEAGIAEGGGGGGDDNTMFVSVVDRSVVECVLPDGLTEIGQRALYGCEQMQSIDIPSSVTKFGSYALANEFNLRTLTVRAVTPPTIESNSLNSLPLNCLIRVPAESVSAYKSAQNWSAKASQIVAITT